MINIQYSSLQMCRQGNLIWVDLRFSSYTTLDSVKLRIKLNRTVLCEVACYYFIPPRTVSNVSTASQTWLAECPLASLPSDPTENVLQEPLYAKAKAGAKERAGGQVVPYEGRWSGGPRPMCSLLPAQMCTGC